MLAKWVSVSREGVFRAHTSSSVQYATLMGERVLLVRKVVRARLCCVAPLQNCALIGFRRIWRLKGWSSRPDSASRGAKARMVRTSSFVVKAVCMQMNGSSSINPSIRC